MFLYTGANKLWNNYLYSTSLWVLRKNPTSFPSWTLSGTKYRVFKYENCTRASSNGLYCINTSEREPQTIQCGFELHEGENLKSCKGLEQHCELKGHDQPNDQMVLGFICPSNVKRVLYSSGRRSRKTPQLLRFTFSWFRSNLATSTVSLLSSADSTISPVGPANTHSHRSTVSNFGKKKI